MLPLQGDIKLKDLRREFESYSLLAEDFPDREEYRKHADFLELLIISIESDYRYI